MFSAPPGWRVLRDVGTYPAEYHDNRSITPRSPYSLSPCRQVKARGPHPVMRVAEVVLPKTVSAQRFRAHNTGSQATVPLVTLGLLIESLRD